MLDALRTMLSRYVTVSKTARQSFFWSVLFCVFSVFIALGPLFYPFDANKTNIRMRNKSPSITHVMGTDQLGRDIAARVMKGGQLSITVGVLAMLVTVTLGVSIGLIAGYFETTDSFLMWITDVFLSLPTLPLLLLLLLLLREPLSGLLGPELGMMLLVVSAISITSWMPTARIIRVEIKRLKQLPFVEAAMLAGSSHVKILSKHLLPNVVPLIAISCTISMANAVVIESTLSFLGLGFPPDYPTWGRLLYDALDYLQMFPSRTLWPGLAISWTVLIINQIGEALNAWYAKR